MSLTKNPSELQFKALKELGDIGASHAVIGISKLLNQRVEISVTHVDVLPIDEIMDVFEGPESMVTVTCFEMNSGNLIGKMFLVFHQQEASKLIKLITGKPIAMKRIENEYDLSVLKEVGNIVFACYIHTLSTCLKKKILHTVPEIIQEKVADVMSVPYRDSNEELAHAVMLETQFELTNKDINGTMFFISTTACMDEIFEAVERN